MRVIGIMVIILLGVSFVVAPSIDDEIEVILTIDGGIICSGDGLNWIDYGTSPPTMTSTTALGECYNPSATGGQFCCPQGYSCNPTGTPGPSGEYYTCEISQASHCYQLTDEDSCEEYTNWVPVNNIEVSLGKGEGYCGQVTSVYDESGETCWEQVSCGCSWDEGESECVAVDSFDQWCTGGQPVENLGICEYTLVQWLDRCQEDGLIFASWNALGTGDYDQGGILEAECQNKELTITCEQVIQLPFFGFIHVLIVIGLLGVFYSLIYDSRR